MRCPRNRGLVEFQHESEGEETPGVLGGIDFLEK
jgi:hypothetical protein